MKTRIIQRLSLIGLLALGSFTSPAIAGCEDTADNLAKDLDAPVSPPLAAGSDQNAAGSLGNGSETPVETPIKN
ncbi:MAG: hypothetical protein EOP09_14070 [Proteobacteria bacterium]|nr:MAG: hypothetical protein EOP09_14070 [Pseudomonadota bacterium]